MFLQVAIPVDLVDGMAVCFYSQPYLYTQLMGWLCLFLQVALPVHSVDGMAVCVSTASHTGKLS